jgi:hypothetical protein
MTVAWDTADEYVWYGHWIDETMAYRLHLVAERLPETTRWAWTVWQADEPKILRRGIAAGATEATIAAEVAAACWRKIGIGSAHVSRLATYVQPTAVQ